jgi:transcriptional regulator of NAD metabolism
MDFRTTYGTLLKTQIEMYARMFEIIEKIEEYDTPSYKRDSNVYTQNRCCLVQKQRLAVQLNQTFQQASQSMERIEHMALLCQQFLEHPVYMQILELHILAESKVNEVINKHY